MISRQVHIWDAKLKALKKHGLVPERWSVKGLASFMTRFSKMWLWATPDGLHKFLGKTLKDKKKDVLPLRTAEKLVYSDEWDEERTRLLGTKFCDEITRLDKMSLAAAEELILEKDRKMIQLIWEISGRYMKKTKSTRTNIHVFEKLQEEVDKFDKADVEKLRGNN